MNIAHYNIAKFVLTPFLDFLFPPVCLSCDVRIEDGSIKICKSCWDSIHRLDQSHPLFLDTKIKLMESGFVADLVSCFVFEKEGAFQKIVHELKYGGFQSLGVELGKRIGDEMNERQTGADLVVPIPLHKRKFRERGFNQAEAIARGVSESTGIPTNAKILCRKKYTQTQTKLDLHQRKKNMEDAFELNATPTPGIEGKRILLVDDVITTGATIVSCAHELRSAGAEEVIAASAALAEKDVDNEETKR